MNKIKSVLPNYPLLHVQLVPNGKSNQSSRPFSQQRKQRHGTEEHRYSHSFIFILFTVHCSYSLLRLHSPLHSLFFSLLPLQSSFFSFFLILDLPKRLSLSPKFYPSLRRRPAQIPQLWPPRQVLGFRARFPAR